MNEEKKTILNYRVQRIENEELLRRALIGVKLSSSRFFGWIDENKEKSKQYARDRAKGIIL